MAPPRKLARQIHRALAPILALPLVVTVVTGSLYQIARLNDNFDYYWLIQIHKGQWGPLDLQAVYPFLNGLGLLLMVATGLSLWLQTRSHRPPQAHRFLTAFSYSLGEKIPPSISRKLALLSQPDHLS